MIALRTTRRPTYTSPGWRESEAFWGYSEDAVKVHLWVAICTYLLLAWVKVALKSPLTITEVSKVVGASLLTKTYLRELPDVPAPLTQNQNVNGLELNF